MTTQQIADQIDSSFSGSIVKAILLKVLGDAGQDAKRASLQLIRVELVSRYGGSNWRIDEVDSMFYANGGVTVGLGATIHHYSDASAYTIVAVSKSGKQITLQADNAILDPNFRPDFHPGGFVGHVSNQNEQTYAYSRNLEAPLIKARLHKDGRFYVGSSRVGIGYRSAFHDYNF